MSFIDVFLPGLVIVMGIMTLVWVVSTIIKNVSIVDYFWGTGFIVLAFYYLFNTQGWSVRQWIVTALVTAWGLRLTLYLLWRNHGKGEDFRYRQFREKYGVHRYWWISFFQTFLLQGVLMWIISAPLLGAQFYPGYNRFRFMDGLGILVWLIGIIFEAGGDFQLARFKSNPANRGKILDTGLWKYTRHPNYFGDACVWWGYGLISIAGGSFIPFYGSLLMTLLIIRVSGVFLLERSLVETKEQYKDYTKRTSAFFPWFQKPPDK